LTTGNHIWKKKEIEEIFHEGKIPIIRPANYPPGNPGRGEKVVKIGKNSLLIVNLMGRVFMQECLDCPFRAIDQILKKYQKEKLTGIVVDFHGEATSEKVAFGLYTDGRISAVLGTHTHIPTADAKILPKGTAYITDVGIVGAENSVLGVDKKTVLERFLAQRSKALEVVEKGKCVINAVLIEIDSKTKKAVKIKRIDRTISI